MSKRKTIKPGDTVFITSDSRFNDACLRRTVVAVTRRHALVAGVGSRNPEIVARVPWRRVLPIDVEG